RCVTDSGARSTDRADGRPGILGRIVAASRGVWITAPDNHFFARPDRLPASAWSADCTDGHPGIGGRIVAAPRVERAAEVESAPDDHFLARPNRPVTPSGARGTLRGEGRPGVVCTTTRPGAVVCQGTQCAGGPGHPAEQNDQSP